MTPIAIAGWTCAAVAFACWLASVLTKEHSWVDRLWSIIPPVYVTIFAIGAGAFDARLALMTALAWLWGARLTFNFARKGGYAPGGEDYRWPVLKKKLSPVAFALLNIFFVAAFQHVLLLWISLPAWVAQVHAGTPLSWLDFVAAALVLVFLAGETLADEQQWRFHQHKAAMKARGEEPATPFLTTGLFRYSRHPNFFCEQAIWWSFYLFSVAASGEWLNLTLAGPLLLSALFQGSTSFTEEITLSRYPSYAEYQKTTSRLMPWFPAR